MRLFNVFAIGFLNISLLVPVPIHSQQSSHESQSDPRALHSLNAAFIALGGDKKRTLADVQISGTLSLASAPDAVVATFIAKARGEDWALETTAGSHTTRYRVLKGVGTLQDESSTKVFQPSITYGSRLDIFPLLHRWTEFGQPGSSATLVGPTVLDGVDCTQVHVHIAEASVDPLHFNQHNNIDVLLDAGTGMVRSIRYKATLGMPAPRPMEVEIRFDDYKQLGSLTVPTRITRYVRGRPLLVFHITSVQTNNGFTDEDFRNHRGIGQ